MKKQDEEVIENLEKKVKSQKISLIVLGMIMLFIVGIWMGINSIQTNIEAEDSKKFTSLESISNDSGTNSTVMDTTEKSEELEEAKETEEATQKSNVDLSNVKFNSEYNVVKDNGMTLLAGTEYGSYQHLIYKEDIDIYSVKSATQIVRAMPFRAATEEYIMNRYNVSDHEIKMYRRYEDQDKYTDDLLKEAGYSSYFEYRLSGVTGLEYSFIIITEKDGEIIATVNPENGTTLFNRLDTATLKVTTVNFKDSIAQKDISLAFNPDESTDYPFMLIESNQKNYDNTSYILVNEDSMGSYGYAINNTDYAEDFQIATMNIVFAIDSLFY